MPAITNIPGLPVATGLIGTELFWAVQNGLDVSVTAAQIVALLGGGGGGGIGNLQPVFGVVIANGTSAPLVTDTGVAGQVLTSNGAGFAPTYQPAPSGTVAGGGTGLNILNPVGGVLIANGVNPINITTAGTTGQVLTSNGTGLAPTFQNASSSSGTVPNGGTGQSTLTTHAVLIGEGTSPINQVGPGTAGQLLTSNGASLDPSFQPLPTITVAGGGTGLTTLFAHGLLVGAGTSNVVSVSPGTANQVLVSNGASADPTFQNLPTITVPSGGTGATTLTNHGVLIGQGTSAVNVSSAGTAGQVLTSNGASADPTFQAIPIPSIDVAHGGTGVATLTSHGVLIGQGTSAVHITSAGTAGQVLTSNGASADPTYQAVAYPPTPAPNFGTWLQNAINTSTTANWIWGNVQLAAPLVITVSATPNAGFVFNGNGMTISNGFNDNTKDLLTILLPTGASTRVAVIGMRLENFTIEGSDFASRGVRQGLFISCPDNLSDMAGCSITNATFQGCHGSGLLIYGNIFEFGVTHCTFRDNDNHDFEIRNPTQGGSAGVISSIHTGFCDFRDAGVNGIATTCDTAFQEPPGCPYVTSSDFIQNGQEGLMTPAGSWCTQTHFEANCVSGGASAIYSQYAPSFIEQCTTPGTGNHGKPMVQFDGGSGHIVRSTFASGGAITVHLRNTGDILIEPLVWTGTLSGYITGPGAGWNVYNPTVTTTVI